MQLAVPGAGGEGLKFGGYRGDGLAAGIPNDRRHQSALYGHGDTDIGTAQLQDAIFGPYNVGFRHLLQRDGQRLDDQVCHRQLLARRPRSQRHVSV